MYSSNNISTKGIIALVNKVEVRRSGVSRGFLFKKNLWLKKKKVFYCIAM